MIYSNLKQFKMSTFKTNEIKKLVSSHFLIPLKKNSPFTGNKQEIQVNSLLKQTTRKHERENRDSVLKKRKEKASPRPESELFFIIVTSNSMPAGIRLRL